MADTPLSTDQATAEPAGISSDDMEASMGAAFDAIEAGEDVDAAVAAQVSDTDRPTSEQDDTGFEPDEAGNQDQDADDIAASDDDRADEGSEADTQDDEGDETGDDQAFVAPEYWNAEAKEKFDALPDDAKALVSDQASIASAAYTRKTQELAEAQRAIAPLAGVADQWEPYLARLGATPEIAFNTLMGAEYTLRTGTQDQKRDAIAALEKQYEIAGPDDYDDAGYEDPKLAQVTADVGLIKEHLTGQQQQAASARNAAIDQTVVSFRDAKLPNGDLAHPYFAQVEQHMAALLNEGLADPNNLEACYEAACAAHPQTRAAVLKGTGTRPAGSNGKSARTAAKRRAAKSNVKGQSSNGSAAVAQKDLGRWDDDGALGEIFDAAQGA